MAEQMLFDLEIKTKVCGACKKKKFISEFNKHYGRPRSLCKKCHSKASVEWGQSNKEHRSAYIKEYHSNNWDRVCGHKRKYVENLTPEKLAKQKERMSWWHIKRKYGLTREMWDKMFEAQNRVCALCQKRTTGRGNGRLDVDHCHETGRVRGLLCRHCNTALGILGDTPDKMERVMDYLRGPP